MARISVIVPVFNVENYLRCCVDSILSQTFEDFELLLINDGSTDKSGEICEEYASKDSRVKVFHKKNGGVSSARNWGLDNASADWVTFVDSDDWVLPNYLQELFSHTDKETDMVFSYPKVRSKNSIDSQKKLYEGLVGKDRFAILFTECGMAEYTYCWAKLYRLAFLNENKISFLGRMTMGEDHIFLYNCILKASKVYVSKTVNYCYRYVDNSLSKRIHTFDMEYYGYVQIYAIIPQLLTQLRIKDPVVSKQLGIILSHYLWRVLQALYSSQIERKKRVEILRELDFSYLNYEHCSALKRCFLTILLNQRWVFLYDFMRVCQQKLKGCR